MLKGDISLAYDIRAENGCQCRRPQLSCAADDSQNRGIRCRRRKTYTKILARGKNLKISHFAAPCYGITSGVLRLKRFFYLEPKIVLFSLIEHNIQRAMQPRFGLNDIPWALKGIFCEFPDKISTASTHVTRITGKTPLKKRRWIFC